MRSFILKNAQGAEWNLNLPESFFTGPKGLGGETKTNYVQMGNRFVKTTEVLKQKSVTGKIIFSGYEEYGRFCRFVQHKPLSIQYTADGTYQMSVSLEKLTKTEMEAAGLCGEITLKGLTTWHQYQYAENMQETYGKTYPYTYDYVYADLAAGAIEFAVDSVEECPVRLSLIGPCVNPAWSLYVNGILKTTGRITGTIKEGRRLVIDATKIPYEIAEYDNSGNYVSDSYPYSDFSTGRFLYASYGQNKITVTHEGSSKIKMAAEVRIEYAFV